MFVAAGLLGALFLVVFLLFDDVLDGILPDADWISGPAIAAFVAAFGLFGSVAQEGFDAPTGAASDLLGVDLASMFHRLAGQGGAALAPPPAAPDGPA